MSISDSVSNLGSTQKGKDIGRAIAGGLDVTQHAPGFRSKPAETLAKKTGSAMLARAGQRVDVVGAVLSLIIVSVIAYVGLDVVAEVESNTDVSGNSDLTNASNSLDSGVEGAFSLMGVVFLVILLSVIIGLFLGLRR